MPPMPLADAVSLGNIHSGPRRRCMVAAGVAAELSGLFSATALAEACGCDLFVANSARPAPDVDRTVWTTFEGNAGYIPRTAFRVPAATPDGRGRIKIRNGAAILKLSKFDPTARIPGDSFWGSHIASRWAFFPHHRE